VPLERCKNMRCKRRIYLIEKCNSKFQNELDVLNILRKVRETYGMLKHIKNDQMSSLMKYTKENTVNLEDSDESKSDEDHDKVQKANPELL
jgi:hypothetical protein